MPKETKLEKWNRFQGPEKTGQAGIQELIKQIEAEPQWKEIEPNEWRGFKREIAGYLEGLEKGDFRLAFDSFPKLEKTSQAIANFIGWDYWERGAHEGREGMATLSKKIIPTLIESSTSSISKGCHQRR